MNGNQAFTFIESAGFGHHAGELRSVTSSNATVLLGDVNGDGTPDFAIAVNKTAFIGGDFVL